MRKFSFVVVLMVALTGLLGTDAEACGDKFLVGVNPVAYQQNMYAHVQPGTILVYRNLTVDGPSVGAWDADLPAKLMEAGHTVELVEDPTELRGALEGGDFDIVMMYLDDATKLRQEVEATASAPTVMPVIPTPTHSEFRDAKKQFGFALKAPVKMKQLLDMVARSLASRY